MMRNELLLLASLVLAYGGALIWLRLFGKSGLYGWTILATIADRKSTRLNSSHIH